MRAVVVVAVVVFAAVFSATAAAVAGQERTWNFAQAAIPGAQAAGNWGEGVTVAVIDTWVDFEHPDLAGRVAGHAVCVNSVEGCRDNRYSPDRCSHGTHVAGTVASSRYGVAPRASVLAVQVLAYDPRSGDCGGTADDVARGIRFAVDNGAEVINLSLGSLVPGLFQAKAVDNAVATAARAGVVVVVAAGNSTLPLSDNYGSNALLVAATGPHGRIASYSTRGGSVSLAAPGGDDGVMGAQGCALDTCILSTVPKGSYALLEGTSMAAPHVSGVAALLLSQLPARGRDDVLTSLRATAHPVAGTQHGLIDATAALRLRQDEVPSPTTASVAPTGDPNTAASQRTRLPRPPAGHATSSDTTRPGRGPDAGRSRSRTFDRPTTATSTTTEQSAGTTDHAGPPVDRHAAPGGDSALPLLVLWGGLAAAGVIGMLSVVGRQRLGPDHDE